MTKKSLAGRKAQSKGAMFESFIEMSCSYYSRLGIADIQKTPEPMKYIRPYGRAGQFIAHFVKQAQPDFKGVLKGGKTILFEAKRTDGKLIQKKRISDEQATNLSSAMNLGAHCFVLLSFKERKFYKVPWDVWEQMEERFNKKSVNEKDLAAFAVPFENGVINFLEVGK